nr:immune inhibitor A domain-containing protein [Brevibacillus laterosporus]
MKWRKTMSAMLASALLFSTIAGVPTITEAKSKKDTKQQKLHQKKKKEKVTTKDNFSPVDESTLNLDRLAKNLQARGIIAEDATQDEIRDSIKEYLEDKRIPSGPDTSSSFGAEAKRSQEAAKEEVIQNVAEFKGKKRSRNFDDNMFVDNIVVSLVEFPDRRHNELPKVKDSIWTADFNEEHYEKMLFEPGGYTTPEGTPMTTMAKYYEEQSRDTWSVNGIVTPWITAEHSYKYYGKNRNGGDARPRDLVIETLEQVGQAIAGHEEEYDQRDPYDLDGDGDLNEPDGILDNLMLVHAGIGEETGEDDDAIWSHRWTLEEPVKIPGTNLLAYDYMIQPEDGAPGVFSHEYGHNLGLPDLYDTNKGGHDSPVGAWSLMSSGSHTGYVFQTEPTSLDPWSKMMLQEMYGGKWISPQVVDYADLRKKQRFTLHEAVNQDIDNNMLLKIDMPEIIKDAPTKPFQGEYSYFSDEGDNLTSTITTPEIDLTDATEATMTVDMWRSIEKNYDFLYLNAIDVDTGEEEIVEDWSDDPEEWEEEEIDLSDYVGKKVKFQFEYVTDAATTRQGVYLDNIVVSADGEVVFKDDGEGKPKMELDGFTHFNGKGKEYDAYYLVELRSYNGADEGLKYFRRGETFLTYDPGMVVWYYDGRYGATEDNKTSLHPGHGMLGVVDSHQQIRYWDDNKKKPADARYQVSDAAFSPNPTSEINLDYILGKMWSPSRKGVTIFSDEKDYSMPGLEDVGMVLPQVGLNIKIKDIEDDFTKATIEVWKD